MIKLSGAVGKMGPNKTCDVAVIQASLMNAKGGPFWPGPIDGKKTTKLVEAITSFQTANRVTPANGTIQSFGPTMNRLKAALPMSMSGLGALPGSAVVFVAAVGERQAEREAEDTKRKAPFPKLEAAALAGIQKSIGKAAGLCLERAEDSVTKDGCFATELNFQGVKWLDPRSAKPMAAGREPAGVTNYVWSQIGTGTPWQKGSPSDLVFKSKRQLKCLQNLGTGPLSADDKKILAITSPPREPVLLACAKGCARLISSGGLVSPAGAVEFELLLQAIAAPNPQLAKQIGQAGGQAGGAGSASSLKIKFDSKADPTVVSQKSLRVLRDAMAQAGINSIRITSTARTPSEQARIMYELIGKRGEVFAKQLYRQQVHSVIGVYTNGKQRGLNQNQIIGNMEIEIVALRIQNPNLFKHIADPTVLNTIDIAPSSISSQTARRKFIAALKADQRVQLVLEPPTDPAIHVEIPQP